MNVDEIRKIARRRPFKPFLFHLDNGEKYAVRHPEIVVGNDLVVTVDNDGKIIMIAPETVTLIEFLEAEPVVAGAKPNGNGEQLTLDLSTPTPATGDKYPPAPHVPPNSPAVAANFLVATPRNSVS